MNNIDINQLKQTLQTAKASWAAGETTQSKLSAEQRRRLLGAIPPQALAALIANKAHAPQITAAQYDQEVDWRNRNGNHVSPVRDQGGCGSCVSFGCAGVIESMFHIEKQTWIDLSEADSHFCSSHGANCTGWWPDECFDEAMRRGVCDEACFRYDSAFPNNDIWSGPPRCAAAPDRDARAFKITSRPTLMDPVAAKNHISSRGPVAGCLDVYSDFFAYKNGVYQHKTGAKEGGHCVLVVGYSESGQFWIIKNSWNTGWGEQGFGRIAYSDLVFGGHFYPMYGAAGVTAP